MDPDAVDAFTYTLDFDQFRDICNKSHDQTLTSSSHLPHISKPVIPTFVETEQISAELLSADSSTGSPVSPTSSFEIPTNLSSRSSNLSRQYLQHNPSKTPGTKGRPISKGGSVYRDSCVAQGGSWRLRTAPYPSPPHQVKQSCHSSVASSDDSDGYDQDHHLSLKYEDLDDTSSLMGEDKREKNRQAAQRCRQKKQERVKRLEENARTLQEQNRQLESTVWKLKRERDGIREAFEYHLRNDCPAGRQ